MVAQHGNFIWYELMTGDVEGAAAFYGKVIGWSTADSGMPGITYTLANVGERQVAGLMGFPPDMQNPRPGWVGYILADDVDAMAEKVRQAGGAVHRPPTDIPGIGRFAVAADPQGAMFMLFRGQGEPPPDLSPATPGAFGWHELQAKSWQEVFGFYHTLFGWEKAEAVDMGEIGTYQTFSANGVWTGGMMDSTQPGAPFWAYYITVEDIDAAVRRIGEAGGTLLNGPHQVPGGSYIVHGADPQGAMFALSGPRH